MAVTAATPANLTIGAGDVSIGAGIGGATTDNNQYTVSREYFVPNLNGVKGPLVGTDYIVSETAMLACTLVEVSASSVGVMIPGSTSATVGDVTTIDTDDTRRIGTSSYNDATLTVPGLNSKEFRFIVDDAIQTGDAEYEAQDDGLLAPRVTLEARWDPASLTASPWRIEIDLSAS